MAITNSKEKSKEEASVYYRVCAYILPVVQLWSHDVFGGAERPRKPAACCRHDDVVPSFVGVTSSADLFILFQVS